VRVVVFTDLDGTLLDHDSYAYDGAQPALDALRARGVPLVLASSKTAAEIAQLHAALGLGATPAIVENGAGIFDPTRPDAGSDEDYRRIRDALHALPDGLRSGFTGFGDMSDGEVAKATGLSLEQAQLAKMRCYSEPGVWTGDEIDRARFLEALAAQGISARSGGRFLTLSFGRTKAERMAEIAHRLGAELTIALGDAPNDVEMIEAADYGVVVRNDHAPALPALDGERTGRVRRTEQPGPAGWNRAVLGLLEEVG